MNKALDEIISRMGSQKAFAEQLGVSQQGVSQWVAQGYMPKPRAMQAWEIFNVPWRELAHPDYSIEDQQGQTDTISIDRRVLEKAWGFIDHAIATGQCGRRDGPLCEQYIYLKVAIGYLLGKYGEGE